MSKFKIGDRVRLQGSPFSFDGASATVSGVLLEGGGGAGVYHVMLDDNAPPRLDLGPWTAHGDQLHLLDPFEALKQKHKTQAETIGHLIEERDRLKLHASVMLSKEDAWPKDAVEAIRERDAKVVELEKQLGEWMSSGAQAEDKVARVQRALLESMERCENRYSFGEFCVLTVGVSLLAVLYLAVFQ